MSADLGFIFIIWAFDNEDLLKEGMTEKETKP